MILRQKIVQISVSTVKKKTETHPDFLARFLNAGEIRYCKSKRHFAEPAAARIAAKQACLALFRIPAKQWAKRMLQIQIKKKSSGKPCLLLSPNLNRELGIKRNQTLLLSLAHERKQAIAWVALTDTVPRGSVRKLTPPRGMASGAKNAA